MADLEKPGITSAHSSPTPRWPPSADVWGDFAMPGFAVGPEFQMALDGAWERHRRRMQGRLERYARFGMTEEEARRPTPEPMREAYDKLLEEYLADYTPTPSPTTSPSPPMLPTPKSNDPGCPGIVKSCSSKEPVDSAQDLQLCQAILPKKPFHSHISKQSASKSESLRPLKPVSRIAKTHNKVVKRSRVGKKQTPRGRRFRKEPRSRHHMETRSRTITSQPGLG